MSVRRSSRARIRHRCPLSSPRRGHRMPGSAGSVESAFASDTVGTEESIVRRREILPKRPPVTRTTRRVDGGGVERMSVGDPGDVLLR